MTGIIRLYTAYNIDSSELYSLAMWTYGVATVHFVVEWIVFRVHDGSRKYALLISTITLGWMVARSILGTGKA